MHQEEMIHFRYLLTVAGGLLHTAPDMDAHLAQLAAAVASRGERDEKNRRFLEVFVRPQGLDVPATPAFVDALEDVPRSGVGRRRRCRRRGLAAPARRAAGGLVANRRRPLADERRARRPVGRGRRGTGARGAASARNTRRRFHAAKVRRNAQPARRDRIAGRLEVHQERGPQAAASRGRRACYRALHVTRLRQLMHASEVPGAGAWSLRPS